MAIPDEETIHDIPYWTKSDPDNMRDQLNRINSALHLLFPFGKRKFDYYRKAFIECVVAASIKGYQIYAVDVWTWKKVSNFYTDPSSTLIDRTILLDEEDRILLQLRCSDEVVVKHSSTRPPDSAQPVSITTH